MKFHTPFSRNRILGIILAAFFGGGVARAQVTLTAGDTFGNSSFNTAGNWSDALAPSAGKTYSDSGFTLRTPATSGSFIFAGNSLTLTNSAALTYKGTSASDVITVGNLILNNGVVVNAASNNFTLAGGITLQSGNGIFDTTSTGNMTISGTISGTGLLTVQETSANANLTVTLTGSNTYSGGTRINKGGTLVVGATNALLASGTVTLGESGNTSGKLQLGTGSSAFSQTVGFLAVSGNGTANAVVGGNAAVSTFTVNNNAADAYSGNLGGAGSNQNNLALTKTGVGALTLSGTNSYTGATVVSAGTLLLANSGASPSSSVSIGVASSAVLDVSAAVTSGTFSTPVSQLIYGRGTINAGTANTLQILGTLNPGTGSSGTASTLNVTGGLSLGGTSQTTLAIYSSGSNDAMGVSRMLTYGGALTLNLNSLVTIGSNVLFTFASPGSGDWSSVQLTGSYSVSLSNSGGVWTGTSNGEIFTFTDNNGSDAGVLSYAVAAVPEPGTLGLVFGGIALLVHRRCRRGRGQSDSRQSPL